MKEGLAALLKAASSTAAPEDVTQKRKLLEDMMQFKDDQTEYGFRSLQMKINPDDPSKDRFVMLQAPEMTYIPASGDTGERVETGGNISNSVLRREWALMRYGHLFEVNSSAAQ